MPVIPENVNLALRGQIGKQWIYWVTAGVQYKRPYVIPYDPKTFAQRTQRNKFYMASQAWNDLSVEEKKEWEEKAIASQSAMSGYNYFLRWKIKEIQEMIKTIQKGTRSCTAGANIVIINAVDMDKSVVHCNFFLTGSFGDVSEQFGIFRARLTSATEITINARDGASLNILRADWTVIEYV